jgi:outer membrane protein
MNRFLRYAACLIAFALIVVPFRAFAFSGLEAGVGYWQQTPSGTLGYQKISPNDDIDLRKDLNYGSKNQIFARVKVELPLVLPNIYFLATPMSFEGAGRKAVNFNFGGQPFSATFPIQSKVKLDHYDLALYYPIPLVKTATLGKLNIDLGLDLRQINFEGTISQSGATFVSASQSASKSLTLYVPMVYTGIQFKPLSLISIEAEGRGLAYGASHYIDYIGRLKIMPMGPLFVSAGYRSEELRIDQSVVNVNIKFRGPFAEAGIIF